MSCILLIETSAKICSVALAVDGKVVFSKRNDEGMAHARLLPGFVDEALKSRDGSKIDAVAVSSGPGSYTGLRIGVATAKGLAFGCDASLIAVPTLELLACTVKKSVTVEDDALICPMIDARRMEVYSQLFDSDINVKRDTEAEIITEESYKELLQSGKKIYFAGDGAAKCSDVIKSENAVFVDGIEPDAANMASLAEERLRKGEFVDVAYFEPFYLKDFVATQSKHKVL
ncbi:MAG: tRNA (adenosine(37)-N6)-threonylcarbamoyltransferase complex dimerization subunit type 1 TsaB [Paludibacteraceae bacterium]|nr:tRNA (adenosine(37)-N6)-threonylcarbamoyltransferase complex dimerization subunit type 1 TsaB [Paludibacteraceae bacterium]MBP5742507.1 tRNA (adenosine(37)-N6)-threonylcarbamoyltransferase complex dimerization subunit type 1 TsaB [Paludibacteraceae bacterium]